MDFCFLEKFRVQTFEKHEQGPRLFSELFTVVRVATFCGSNIHWIVERLTPGSQCTSLKCSRPRFKYLLLARWNMDSLPHSR